MSVNQDKDRADGPAVSPARIEGGRDSRSARTHPWVNWTLAVLTVPAAAVAVLFGLGVVMSYDACSDKPCRQPALGGDWFEVLWFASPAVAALTIAASFFTARRRTGIVVPLCGWALIAADVGLLASYAQP